MTGGKRGPSAKPSAVKRAEGNPGKQKLNVLEPRPPVGSIAMPRWLSKDGREVWKKLLPILLETKGLITKLDQWVIAIWCDTFGAYREAVRECKRHGRVMKVGKKGYKQVAVWETNRRKAALDLIRIGQELGMTPAARCRLQLLEKGEPNDELSDWLLKGRNN